MNLSALPDAVVILVLTVVSVLLIVTDFRFEVEKTLRAQRGIDRDWWVPPVAFAVAFALSIVGWSAVRTAFFEKFEIIVLIFSFGIMSEGLGESGFFRYIAYKIVDKCSGNSARLILYLFTMTSITTLFTTNDIVVLVITPIIVEVCFQAGIRNAKLVLLSQFIAANTLSMGLLIGSPTNIIIADEMNIDFFTYLLLMLLPAIIAFCSSFVLINWTIRASRNSRFSLFSDLQFQRQYSMPQENPEPYFTDQMRNWILIFAVFVVMVAFVTYWQLTLLLCAIPSIAIAVAYWHFSDEHSEPVTRPIRRLPYGIFFFGMTFFVFAEAFSRTAFMNATLVPFLQQFFAGEPIRASLVGVFGSGLLVNVFNDLPAAALVGKIISKLHFETFVTKHILIQGSLVGLNIGTYVTQIGALAGLIWFNKLRIERKKQEPSFPKLAKEMSFPNRRDLMRYGFVHFCFAGLVTGLFLIFEWVLLSYLVGPYSI